MKQKLCAILILIMLLLNSSLMTVISVAVDAVSDATNSTNEEVEENAKVSNVDLKLNAEYLVNNVENNVELTATLKTDDTKYSLFKNPTISIEMPAEIVDVILGTPYLMYNNQIFTITNSEVVTNETGNKVINIGLEGEQTEYETDSILEGTNIVIPANLVVSKQIDTMVSNIKLRYTNEIESQTIYEANGEDCEQQEITLINKIVRNLPAISSDEEAKTIEFEQNGVKVEIIEKVGNTVIPDNGTLYEQQIVKNIVRFTNNSTTAKPINFTANIPEELTYIEFVPQEIVHNEEYDAYYIPRYPYYIYDASKKQININIEQLGIGETQEGYFECRVEDLGELAEKIISIDYELINDNGEAKKYSISNTINEAEITAFLDCYRLNDRTDWQYALTVTNITDRTLNNINIFCEIDRNFSIDEIYKYIGSGEHEEYDLSNVQDNTFTYTIDSIEPGEEYYIAVNGRTKDMYENNDTNTYEMKGVYTVYGDEINRYVSNETSVTAGIEKVKVSMTSDKEGQEIKTDDEITYTINIQNIGNEKLAMSKYSNITVSDFIPDELEPISATYNNFVIDTQYISGIADYVGAQLKVETYTEEQKDVDLTYRVIPEGSTEDEVPNLNLNLSIPYGKTITIVIKAKVKMVIEKSDITNSVTVEGKDMLTKTASATNTLLPYNYDEELFPEQPEEPDSGDIGGGTIVDPENPEQPTEPEESTVINVTGVELIPSETTLKVGQSANLIANVVPSNATNKAISWSSSDESVAVIVNGTVMAIKEGTAVITVVTEDGNKTATSTVIVESNNGDDSTISVTGIQITPNTSTILIGGTVKLRAAVLPSNATNTKVNWSSSNEEVATVSDNGLVTGIKEGTATITVTTEDGNKTATCEIIVQNVNGGSSTPTDPESPEEPTDPESPTNPEQPEEPTDPENPTNPEQPEEKVTVSGTAWIDSNENGKRDEGENIYSNMTVMLYNYGSKKLVSIDGIAIEKKTDESGRYEFTDLEKGKYIVIFWYDTANYELTEYQKVGVANSENSDAVSKNVTLQGEKKLAGLTDILTIEQNVENIDIGLVENKEFDFSIQKYISKITIQTSKETKTYTYDNKNFAKVEVHSKQINGAQAIIEYKMVVKNEGELPGKVDLIVDEVPSDLNFYSELNSNWYKSKDGICTTALAGETIGVGETREVTIVLTKNLSGNNVGAIANTAKIAQTSNEKAIEEENVENNTAKAEVLITVSTGIMKWIGLVVGTLIVLGIIAFIAIKDKKLMKTISFMFVIGILIFGNATKVFAVEFISKEYADEEWSSTGYEYSVQVGDEVLELRCVEPNATMCGTGPSYHKGTFWKKKEVEGTRTTSSYTGDTNIPDNVDFTLQNETVQTNVGATVNGNTIKMGPFRINAVRDGISATDVNVKTCNVTYSILQEDGSILNNQVLELNNVVLGQDFYINLPINTIRVDKINVSAECSYQAKIKYTAYYRYYYTITATGSAGDHHKACLTSNLQTLARDDWDEGEYEENAYASKDLEIRGPWSVPGNLLIEKVSYDREGKDKTYLKDIGIKITKGTDVNASKYLGLYDSNGVRATSVKVGENLEFSNYATDESTINPTVKINGVNYTAKWDSSKDNATKLILTEGKVLVKNLKVSEKYTVIEVENPNYGYDTVVNKDITASIQITQPPNSQNVLTMKNGKGTGSLVIKKVDEDNNSTVLEGVQVVIKAKKNDQEMGYIKIIADESVSNVSKFENTDYAEFVTGYAKIKDMEVTDTAPIMYVDTPEEATRFITGSDGIVTVANLPATFVGANNAANEKSEKWYYKVEEHANPNYGYAKEKYSEFGNVTYLADSTETWAVDTNTGWKLLPTVYLSDSNDPTHVYGASYKVTMTNKKLTGNIYIDKYDVEAGSDEKLEHIGFVLKADLIENTENSNSGMFNMSGKYIKVKISHGTHSDDDEGFANYTEGKVRIADGGFVGTANSVIKFVDNPEDATIFYTNQDGEILIANILESTNGSNYLKYKIEEYDSKAYGYVTGKTEESINSTVVFVEDKVTTDSELPTYLPEGYSYVEGDLETGIVIQDKAGNQYVWVEVPKTTDVYQTAGLNITQFTDEEYEKIENDLHTYTSDYRQEGLVDEYAGNDDITGLTQIQYNNQKKEMLKSVYQHGGFYVGRYETGIENTWRTEDIEPTETPVIKANAYPYDTITSAEAQSLASSFATDGYTSSLMFGVQWDLMLKYIETNGTTQESLTKDSHSWGNYFTSSYNIDNTSAKYSEDQGVTWKNGAYGKKDITNRIKLSTGASDTFAKQNIYDIAGNVWEFTLEKDSNTSNGIVLNGGSYRSDGYVGTYANAYYAKTDNTSRDSTTGFRVTLYKAEDIIEESNIERVTKDGWVTPKRQKSTATKTNAVNENVCVDVKIGNFKQTGNLEINKVDSDDQNKKLESVKFVLQAQIEQDGKTVNKYVKAIVDANKVITGTGGYTAEAVGDCRIRDITNSLNNTNEATSLEFVDNVDEATRFVTNSEGQIRILNLLVSTDGVNTILYRPVEVENLNYGYYEVPTEYTVEYESNDGWLEVERQEFKYTSSWDYIDVPEENVETAETSPYLPLGFYYLDGTDLNTGLVIEDRLGNQYVWVEVPRNATVYPTAGLDITEFTDEEFKKIENDLHSYTTVYRNGTSNVDEYSGNDNSTGLTKGQYNELKKKMLKSVYQNGGFYIGRYETGIADSYRTSAGETLETPVIQEFAYPYTYVTNSQAQSLASSFAKNGYSTSLMFGVQWDLVLKYLETKGSTQYELNEDSLLWGNYFDSTYYIPSAMVKYSNDVGQTWSITSSYLGKYSRGAMLLSTGASKYFFSKQNIYELAGNTIEWTLEYDASNSKYPSVLRGGSISYNGLTNASMRGSTSDTANNAYTGFRVALYTNKEPGSKFTTTTIKNKKYTTNIQINKVDIDSNESLERATFVIKATSNKQFADKYVRIIPDDGSNSYTLEVTGSVRVADKVYTSYDKLPCVDFVDNVEDATHFITDENGQIQILNLIMKGIEFIQYTPIEVKNDHYGYVVDGSNETVRLDGYFVDFKNGPTKIDEQTRESGYSEADFTFNRQSSTDTLLDTAIIKNENIITVKNIKQTGNLYINKGDYEQFDDVKLEQVTFLVKAHLEGNSEIDGKYIKILPDGSTSYADTVKGEVRVQDKVYNKETEQNQSPLLFVDKDSATKFVTNEEGKIIIMNLLMSSNGTDHITYSFEEIHNGNYGYVADGTNVTLRHKGQSLETIQDAKYTIPILPSTETSADASQENKEKYPINLRNIKQTGNLKINKVDFDDGSRLEEEVTFAVKIRSNENPTINGKYIKIIADPIYQANVEDTDNDGYAETVKGMVRVKDQCYNTDNYKVSVKYVSNYNDATKFVTDSNGQIAIMNLAMSVTGNDTIEYIFEEIENDNYGYVAELGQYNNYTLRYPGQDINTVETVIQKLERQSSVETLNQPDSAQEVTLRNIKQTGNLVINKIDKNTKEELANVEFVLKAQRDQDITDESNKYYDKVDGRYVKAETETLENGGIRLVDIEFVSNIEDATKFKTDEHGKLEIYNILMSTNGADKIMYQLIETKNPNYGYLADSSLFADFKVTYNGEKLNGDYAIIDRQTKSETEAKVSGNDTTLTVENEPTYTRLSGMVWEDIAGGKSNTIDNQYIDSIYNNSTNSLEGDALIQGIEVFLYKDGQLVATTVTDENGCYSFGTYHEDGIYENSDYWDDIAPERDGDTLISKAENENGNIVISDLSKYYIEFIYDGLRYTTVKQGETENGATEVNNSKGKESAEVREEVNNNFTTVYGGTRDENFIYGDSSNGNEQKYELQYNPDTPQNNQSEFIEHWTYSEYALNNENKKFFTSDTDTGHYTVVSHVDNIEWNPEYAKIDIIPYINQGLYRREQPDLAISSDIEKVETIVNGYTNTYIYGNRNINEDLGEESDGFGVEVKYGNNTGTSYSSRGLNTYSRPLYASDLAYNLTSDEEELMQVFITYQIVVKNQSNTLTARVNEIANYFDSRYEIESVNGATYDVNAIVDVSDENQTVNYKKVILTLDETIPHGQKGSLITIRFKLNKDALKAISNERATLYNVSEITSYSTFYGDGTLCAENKTANENNVVNKIYAGIDNDSAPGSANVVAEREDGTTKIKLNGDNIEYDYSTPNVKLSDISKATFEDDTDLAPSLVLGIDEEEPTRGLTGIVFEDNAIFDDCNNEEHIETGVHIGETRVGNGIYDEGENLIKDAKVELYNVEDNSQGEPTEGAKLYKLIIDGITAKVETEDASTWSGGSIEDETYNYKFMGVIPGKYLIRYSYGNIEEKADDGTTTSKMTQIVQPDGTVTVDSVDAIDYKSTVIKSNTIKDALDLFNIPDRLGNTDWILGEVQADGTIQNTVRYSDAADDLSLRKSEEDEIYYGRDYELSSMTADTAVFNVGVEFEKVAEKKDESGNIIAKETEIKLVLKDTNGDGFGDKVVKLSNYSMVNPYQDFGIIERAKQDAYIEKTVSNIRIVLATGQELINGNPYEDKLSYVKALKMSNNPRQDNDKKIIVEMDNEILQGATLYLDYDITAYNNSEKDYKFDTDAGKKFYYFGDVTTGVEVESAIKKVVDYMDSDLVFDKQRSEADGNWEIVTVEQLAGTGEGASYDNGKRFISKDVEKTLKENNYTMLVTKAFEDLKPGDEPKTIHTYASKLLAISEDLTFENHVEIIHTTWLRKVEHSTPGNYDPSTQQPNEQDDDNIKIVITPPTGLPLSKVNQ